MPIFAEMKSRIAMNEVEQRKAAQQFAEDWEGKGYEKGQSQTFWLMLLSKIFGIAEPDKFIAFEDQVHLDHTAFIDGHIRSTHVLIEQKSLGKDLRATIKQSDGNLLTPFQQAKRYSAELPYKDRPRWIVTCNFSDFLVYDMNHPNGEPEHIELKNLGKEYYRLKFLVDTGDENIRREMEVSMKAGEIIGNIYDKLLEQCLDPTAAETLHGLNMLCVRLVFCLFAEDAGIFGHKRMFGDYIRTFPANKVRRALLDLFRVLDQKPEERDPYLEEELAAFPYVNGGLFSEENATIPQFTEELKDLLCRKASDDFDWSEISPTIFGAIFESTLNPVTRRTGGMHYTSIENIHKVIDPLFMDALKAEFNEIASIKLKKTRDEKLAIFQRKMGALTFLDPACGSGNFLTESFISLRRLENDCLRLRFGEAGVLDVYDDAIQVHIRQFYGIEINDFATTVAKTALWIAESQMMAETAEILHRNLEFLPLKSYANIRKGDALKLDWCEVEASAEKIPEIYAQHANIYLDESLLAKEKDVVYGEVNVHVGSIGAGKQSYPEKKQVIYDYIIGNPPFVGARMMSQEQKDALLDVFGKKWKNAGNLDFVCAWYKKAAEIVEGRKTRAALVSTNSVCQGETVANLWQPLMTRYGVKIDFAHRTFRWDSESEQKAHVHCVIVGFSHQDNDVNKKLIFDGENKIVAQNINGYLLDAENIFVQSRNKPLCEVPQMDFGNMPNDAKGMLSNFTKEEKEYYCKKYPELNPVFRRLFGSEEYINNKERYCLWFVKQDLSVIRRIPEIKSRIEKVKDARASSSRQGTRKLADYPYLFGEIRQPETDFIIIPRVSSERRGYVPIGFLAPENIVNDSVQVIPDATLYHFGILTSHVHMAWIRAVCGRLKSDYRYSKDIVYNNFPWPTPNEEQKAKIEQTAQAILDARALYPDSSLADLYDEVVMPIELRKAHQANDRAVMAAYGFPVKDFTEQDCVARLMEMYKKLIENQ